MMTQTCAANAPADPNASLITPAYVIVSPECVNRIRKSTDSSARTATTRIIANAGTTPRTFMIAGIDMIPAPTMLVATLNTAPGTEAGGVAALDSPRRGALTPATGDMPAVKQRGSEKVRWRCAVPACLLSLNGLVLFCFVVFHENFTSLFLYK